MNVIHVPKAMYLAAFPQMAVSLARCVLPTVLIAVVALFGMGDMSSRADTAETRRLMHQLQKTRLDNLIRHQPELAALLSGVGSGALNADVTDDRGVLHFSSGVDAPLWARASGRWDDSGKRKVKYGFGAMGLHTYVTPTLVVGGMIEADYLSQAGAQSDRAGGGVMAGSYFLARHANQPLFVEGRLLRGRASHSIRGSGDGALWPDTRRGLAQLKLTGQLRYGVTTLTPSFLASYATDDVLPRGSDPLGVQGIQQRQMQLGLEFRHTLREANGAPIILTGGGAFSRTSTRRFGHDALALPGQRSGSGRVSLGIRFSTQAGGSIAIDSFWGGLGTYAPENYGLKAGYDIRF
ncbi:hypothetical protein [uncultured Tateyamaria sp.]|uniref:hypothetical protein n=1 Tax=uncultured Tateyamaria sp. TaxID=455651 RepID=UPI002621AC93|nr:hypothetical protein [uncultured Tateyamaria sp.]